MVKRRYKTVHFFVPKNVLQNTVTIFWICTISLHGKSRDGASIRLYYYGVCPKNVVCHHYTTVHVVFWTCTTVFMHYPLN